jgi:hypothetical protein
MRAAAVAIPLKQNRLSRGLAVAGALLAVFAGIGWSVYAATTERGDLGPSYAPDWAASTGRVLLVAVGLLGLRVLLTRPQLIVGNHALAIVEPLRFARPLVLARDAVESVIFDAPGWRRGRRGRHPVIGDDGVEPGMTIRLAGDRRFLEPRRIPLGGTGALESAPLPRGSEVDRLLVAVDDVDLARSVLSGWGAGPGALPPRPVAIDVPPITSPVGRLCILACCALIEVLLRFNYGALIAELPTLLGALALAFAIDARRYRRALAAAVAAYEPPRDARARERRLALNLYGQ